MRARGSLTVIKFDMFAALFILSHSIYLGFAFAFRRTGAVEATVARVQMLG